MIESNCLNSNVESFPFIFSFITMSQVKDKYVRNWKHSIRCFPDCRNNKSHCKQGFCGSPFEIDFQITWERPSIIDYSDFLIFRKVIYKEYFLCVSFITETLITDRTGCVMVESEALKYSFIAEGKLIGTRDEFNGYYWNVRYTVLPRSWKDYYMSNKSYSDVKHLLRVSLFQRVSEKNDTGTNLVKVLKEYYSAKFHIQSSKYIYNKSKI